MNYPEFKEWPKLPRLFDATITVTEKIDGTNGIIHVTEDGDIFAGSRTRWLAESKTEDNYGFCRWVMGNKNELVSLLGAGYHYGEWWGNGIQRGYNMDKKVFSLFNVYRWGELANYNPGETICDVVPFKTFELKEMKPSWDSAKQRWLYTEGTQIDDIIEEATKYFMFKSRAAEKYGKDFRNPEGYVMYHDRAKQYFKIPVNK